MVSNDEIGYTGDVINEMTEGLKERDLMKRSLELAMEVQQNLLPKENPRIKGLELIVLKLQSREKSPCTILSINRPLSA